ncbi:tetratricopeptide repeat protein [Streptomyces cyaneofuscatus]
MSDEREAPNDTAVGVDNSVSDGTFHAPVVQAGAVNGGVHTYYGQPPYFSLPPVSEWPRLDTADPIALGVRRTRRLPGESPLPPYVARDCDRELDARVREAAGSGGLVVVTGAPLSGKTRTAWTALCANLSDTTRVFAPSPGTDLRGLPAVLRERGQEGCVLWLDDLEGHLRDHGLTPTLLAELVRLRVPVLATMDDEVYDARRFGTSVRAGVLSWADPVELQRVWSEGEQRRLIGFFEDLRLRNAVIWCGAHTVPEYLAVGPELMEEWRRARRRDAHPRGHLLVRAAIDLARCGLLNVGISDGTLRTAISLYPEESATAESEPFEEGLAWAAEPRYGVTGLLVPQPDKVTWTVAGSLFADVDDRPGSPPVPLGMWMVALEAALAGGSEWVSRSIACDAHEILAPMADRSPAIPALLGRINITTGDLGAAEHWYRKAADAGDLEAAAVVGELLVSGDATAEAIPYLETAAEAGIVRAQYRLGKVLAAGAMSWLTRAAEAGHRAAADALPPLRRVTDTPPDTVKE